MTVAAVVKVGGSLLRGDGLPALLVALGDLAGTHALVAVPGGGPFADAVRLACAGHDPGESAAHWMAVLAMDQHAHLLAGLEPRARIVTSPEDVAATVARGRLAVLAPFAWLSAEDPLPHGWHVTSDSIAAWVAARLSGQRLVLLKAVEGVRDGHGALVAEADLRAASSNGLVDEYLPQAVERGLECWILSGRHPERLAELLRTGRAPGSRLR